MKKKIVIVSIFTAILMLVMPNISAVNTQVSDNKIIDTQSTISKIRNIDLDIFTIIVRLLSIAITIGLIPCMWIIIPLIILWMVAGFFVGLIDGEPIKRSLSGIKAGILHYFAVLTLFFKIGFTGSADIVNDTIWNDLIEIADYILGRFNPFFDI